MALGLRPLSDQNIMHSDARSSTAFVVEVLNTIRTLLLNLKFSYLHRLVVLSSAFNF